MHGRWPGLNKVRQRGWIWTNFENFFFLFAFKGYTCRFKSEVFASFASIALRPWLVKSGNFTQRVQNIFSFSYMEIRPTFSLPFFSLLRFIIFTDFRATTDLEHFSDGKYRSVCHFPVCVFLLSPGNGKWECPCTVMWKYYI